MRDVLMRTLWMRLGNACHSNVCHCLSPSWLVRLWRANCSIYHNPLIWVVLKEKKGAVKTIRLCGCLPHPPGCFF
jgi:hypothetical protein